MMKHAAWLIALTIAAGVTLGYLFGLPGEDFQAVAAPPLSLEGLLDEKLPEAPKDPVKLKADNQACYVCHGNYKEDELAVAHGKEDVGCADCHGKSYDHRDDEDNIIPPDVMFPAENIEKCCEECHKEHDAPAWKVVSRWQERCPSKTDPAELVCTDCHFDHRLKRRTVRWDKKTGEVLARQKQPAQVAPDATK